LNRSSIVVGVFADPLSINGRLLIRLLNPDVCTRCLFRAICVETGLYATVISILKTSLKTHEKNVNWVLRNYMPTTAM
jgi:hypothetical protein